MKTPSPPRRNERGAYSIQALAGIAVGGMVVAGAAAFTIGAFQIEDQSDQRAKRDTDATRVLNQAAREIQDVAALSRAETDQLELVKVTPPAGGERTATNTTVTYTFTPNDAGTHDLVRSEGGLESVLATNVIYDPDTAADSNGGSSAFRYFTRTGDPAPTSTAAALVVIDYKAKTKAGVVEMQTAAAVNANTVNDNSPDPEARDVFLEAAPGDTVSVNLREHVSNMVGECCFTMNSNPLPGITRVANAPNVRYRIDSDYSGDTSQSLNVASFAITDARGKQASANIWIKVTPVELDLSMAGPRVVYNGCTDTGTSAFTVSAPVHSGVAGDVLTRAQVGAATSVAVPANGVSLTGAAGSVLTVSVNVDSKYTSVNNSPVQNPYVFSYTMPTQECAPAGPAVQVAPAAVPGQLTDASLLESFSQNLLGNLDATSSASGTAHTVSTMNAAAMTGVPALINSAAAMDSTHTLMSVRWTKAILASTTLPPYTAKTYPQFASAADLRAYTANDAGLLIVAIPNGYELAVAANATDDTTDVASDTGRAFPPAAATIARGSDLNLDGTVDKAGTNLVNVAPSYATAPTGLTKSTATLTANVTGYYSERRVESGVSDIVFRPTVAASNTGKQLTACDTNWKATTATGTRPALQAPAAGYCTTMTETNGTETTYFAALTYAPLANDLDQAPHLFTNGTYNAIALPAVSTQAWDANYARRAYQAPSKAAAVKVIAGSALSATACKSSEGTLTVYAHDTTDANGVYGCGTGSANVGGNLRPDHGAGSVDAYKYCGYTDAVQSGCKFSAKRPNANAASKEITTTGQTFVGVNKSASGVLDTYDVTICNLGGCTNASEVTAKVGAMAGAFTINGFQQDHTNRYDGFNRWEYVNGALVSDTTSKNTTPTGRLNWTASEGAATYDMSAVRKSSYGNLGSNFAVAGVRRLHSGSGDDAAKVAVDALYGANVIAYADGSNFTGTAVSGKMWRKSTSGASGKLETTFHTSLKTPVFVQDSAFCRASVDAAWRYGFQYVPAFQKAAGIAFDDTKAKANNMQLRRFWWVGVFNKSRTNADVTPTAQRWYNIIETEDFKDVPDTFDKWSNSSPSTSGTAAYAQTAVANSQAITGALVSQNVPAIFGDGRWGGASLRLEVFKTPADAGKPDYGDLTYWVGSGTETASNTKVGALGARVTMHYGQVPATDTEVCHGNTNAKHKFDSTSPWTVLGNGLSINRRAQDTMAKQVGLHQTPNAAKWAEVVVAGSSNLTAQ